MEAMNDTNSDMTHPAFGVSPVKVTELEEGESFLVEGVTDCRYVRTAVRQRLREYGYDAEERDDMLLYSTLLYRDNWVWEGAPYTDELFLSYGPYAKYPEGEVFGAWLVML